MTTKPRTNPRLAHGEGSWSWSARLGKIELWHALDGKRHVERGETHAACIAKRDARRAKAGLVDDGTTTVEAMCSKWLALEGSGSPQTVGGYRWAIGHITAALGATEAAELTAPLIEGLMRSLVEQPMKAKSIDKVRSILTIICRWATRWNYFPNGRNPMHEVDTRRLMKQAPRAGAVKFLDLAEAATVERFIVGHHTTVRAAFLTMMLTGLRPGECLALCWDAVDLDAGVLRVERTLRRDRANRTHVVTATLKTDHHGKGTAHRTVPLHPRLVEVLRRERVEQLARGRSVYVFANADGSHFLPHVLQDGATRLARDAGVGYVNPNGYRHTFASMCRHHGMRYEVLAMLMGHRDASMIVKTYGHPLVPADTIDMRLYVGVG